MQTRSQKKHVPAAQVHVGDHFGFSTYGVVTGAASDKFDVRTNTGEEWKISKDIFPQKIYSASWFGETYKVSRTEMAALLHNAVLEPLTIKPSLSVPLMFACRMCVLLVRYSFSMKAASEVLNMAPTLNMLLMLSQRA